MEGYTHYSVLLCNKNNKILEIFPAKIYLISNSTPPRISYRLSKLQEPFSRFCRRGGAIGIGLRGRNIAASNRLLSGG